MYQNTSLAYICKGDDTMDNLDCRTQTYLEEYYCILKQMMEKMTSVQLTCSISYNFIVQMIPHHRAAILMSCNVLKYTKNTALQEIAFTIIREQTKSIENMKNILACCQKQINTEDCLYQYQSQIDAIMRIMFSKMSEACASNNIDENFIREMIPHHEGAIAMANTTLQYDICPELRPILKAIVTSQTRGVHELQRVLQTLQCQ